MVQADNLIRFSGGQAVQIEEKLTTEGDGLLHYATVYNYTDLEMRVVWAYLHEDSQSVTLLNSVYQSGQWDTQNILETLLTSEVTAYAAAPRLKVEGVAQPPANTLPIV